MIINGRQRADHDNPKIIGGNDHTELNRTEGYEMLYFIRSLSKTFGWAEHLQKHLIFSF
jgi:hypothetical protein